MDRKVVSTSTARDMMMAFARLTGLFPQGPSLQRYLWTDAFGVCNFLGLYRETADEAFKELCLKLIDQVHHVLGRHRPDDRRTGWISGFSDPDGELHPTAGGLRIGKNLTERREGERADERLEWEQDGQYYHYLTKWMHALNLATRSTQDFTYNRWAAELARRACARFVHSSPYLGGKAMYWKMSIDLSRPLVATMGHHDPLDGLITYTQIEATTTEGDPESGEYGLGAEIAIMEEMCAERSWATDDPLGLGGLMSDSFRVAQLMLQERFRDGDLLDTLLDASMEGLAAFTPQDTLNLPARYRLPFRELGLSIGIRALERLERLIEQNRRLFRLKERVEALTAYQRLAEVIEGFWLQPEHRQTDTWIEHRNINMVMLATSLSPDGYLTLSSRPSS